MRRLADLFMFLGVGSTFSCIAYCIVNYWGSPGVTVCQTIQSVTNRVPKSCIVGPQWPIWLCIGLLIVFSALSVAFRDAYRSQSRRSRR